MFRHRGSHLCQISYWKLLALTIFLNQVWQSCLFFSHKSNKFIKLIIIRLTNIKPKMCTYILFSHTWVWFYKVECFSQTFPVQKSYYAGFIIELPVRHHIISGVQHQIVRFADPTCQSHNHIVLFKVLLHRWGTLAVPILKLDGAIHRLDWLRKYQYGNQWKKGWGIVSDSQSLWSQNAGRDLRRDLLFPVYPHRKRSDNGALSHIPRWSKKFTPLLHGNQETGTLYRKKCYLEWAHPQERKWHHWGYWLWGKAKGFRRIRAWIGNRLCVEWCPYGLWIGSWLILGSDWHQKK